MFTAALIVGGTTAWLRLALFGASYLLVGYDVLIEAVRGLFRGAVISENFLMSIATVGAFAIGEYPEGVLVMLLYQIGESFQHYAVGRSRKSIAELMDIRPDTATALRDGQSVTVAPEDVAVGETILIKPGERVPLDGVVVSGRSTLDTAALTGEAVPRDIDVGMELLSGCVNLTGVLTAVTVKVYGESTVSKILELVENASGNKSRSERFITRFARVYTPAVVVMAVLLAAIPPLVTGQAFSVWLYRALSFLVVSCPCALVISVPITFFGGIGGASRQGILIKGGNDLETLAMAKTVVFDKTGTLTQGVFDVQAVHSQGMDEKALIEWMALAESGSNHPISQSLRRAYGMPVSASRVTDIEEIHGHGVRATVDGKDVLAGNARLMERQGIAFERDVCEGTIVHGAVNGRYVGHIVIADTPKPDAKAAVAALRSAGIRELVMLTGDTKAVGEAVAEQLGIDRTVAELLPGDKVREVEALMKETKAKGALVFVGDGINDAPVLARADVGVAMGALGSDAAIEAADVVIMTDEPSKLPVAIRLAKRTMGIAKQNIVFSLGVKAAVLVLSALNLTTMLVAVLADVGVMVLAVLNALRTLQGKTGE